MIMPLKTFCRGLFVIVVLLCGAPLYAQSDPKLDELFEQLRTVEEWQPVEREILAAFSRSGSAAMDLLLERGWAAIDQGNLNKAVEHLSALIDHDPDFAEAYNARATAFYLLNEPGLSIADIREVLVRNPRHFGALTGLGFIFEEMGNLEGAYAAFREAQAIHPHLPDVNAAIERLAPSVGDLEL